MKNVPELEIEVGVNGATMQKNSPAIFVVIAIVAISHSGKKSNSL